MITSYKEFIAEESKKDYYIKLKDFVKDEYSKYTCFPPYKNIFHAQAVEKNNPEKMYFLLRILFYSAYTF